MPHSPHPPRGGRASSALSSKNRRPGGGAGSSGSNVNTSSLGGGGVDEDNGNGNNSPTVRLTTSAPLASAKKKQHQHQLMTQLRNAIYETYQSPPDGATEAMVLERRAQLQYLLDNVEKQYQQSKDEALQSYNERWIKAFEEQRRREERIQREAKAREDAGENQAREVRAHQLQRIALHNKVLSDHIQRGSDTKFDQLKERSLKFDQKMAKKQLIYDKIQAKRESDALEHLQRQIEAERKCEQMLQRKHDLDEADRADKEAKAAARRRAADERLDALKKQREAEAKQRAEHARDAYSNASNKKFSVVLRPRPHLVEVQNDYEARYKQQHDAEEERTKQAQRLKEEALAVYRATVVHRHNQNREKQLASRDKELEGHAKRCEEMAAKIAADNLEAKQKAAERKAENLLRLQLKDEEVSLHRQRHAENVHGHQDSTKRRVYERWNRQLQQVSQELGIELPQSSSVPRQQQPQQSPAGRSTKLPQSATAAGSGAAAVSAAAAAGGRRNSSAMMGEGGAGGLDHHSTTFMTQGGRPTSALS